MTGAGPALDPSREELHLLERAEDVAALAARAARAGAIALDVEANGLFAYRPRLCTVQLAFREGDRRVVAIVDTLRAPVAPLAPLLGPAGPTKVLHDLTFDARLLAESGAPLGRVRDTCVAARFLGRAKVGLAALLGAELGVHHEKGLQQHDWARRPIAPSELHYLAEDVRHLLALDARLAEPAAALGIEDEIEVECAYRLEAALRPPRDARPAHVRVKGAAALDPPGRAILRRLVLAREAIAEAADVPPFKVIANEILLAIAARRPATPGALHAIPGAASGRAGRSAAAWLAAVEEGLRDGDVPEDERALLAPARPSRAELALRRAREAKLTSWRRVEAKARGVDEQVILPGHCAQELIELAIAAAGTGAGMAPDAESVSATEAGADMAAGAERRLLEAIARIPGLGARRMDRYGDALLALTRISAR